MGKKLTVEIDIETLDKLTDVLNVACINAGNHKRKTDDLFEGTTFGKEAIESANLDLEQAKSMFKHFIKISEQAHTAL